MDYEEYINERLKGMYSIIESSDNPILEEYIKRRSVKKDDFVGDFIAYLRKVYGKDFDIKKELKNAESKEEQNEILQKYQKDFDKWRVSNNVKVVKAAAKLGLVAADFAGILPKDKAKKVYKWMAFDSFISLSHELSKGFK